LEVRARDSAGRKKRKGNGVLSDCSATCCSSSSILAFSILAAPRSWFSWNSSSVSFSFSVRSRSSQRDSSSCSARPGGVPQDHQNQRSLGPSATSFRALPFLRLSSSRYLGSSLSWILLLLGVTWGLAGRSFRQTVFPVLDDPGAPPFSTLIPDSTYGGRNPRRRRIGGSRRNGQKNWRNTKALCARC